MVFIISAVALAWIDRMSTGGHRPAPVVRPLADADEKLAKELRA